MTDDDKKYQSPPLKKISDEVKVTPETTQFAELSFLHNVR